MAAQVGGDGFLFEPPAVTLSLRGGYALARAGSDVFDETVRFLTLEKSDFAGFTYGGDLGVRVTDRLSVMFSAMYSRSGAPSEQCPTTVSPCGPDADTILVDSETEVPVAQDTRLKRIPLTASLRYYPTGRGRTIGSFAWVPSTWAPYVGAGAGGMYHSFKQEGEFVLDDMSIVDGVELESSGWSTLAQVFAGIERSLGRRSAITAEVAYLWSSTDLGSDFVDFEPIDLAGLQMTAGISFGF